MKPKVKLKTVLFFLIILSANRLTVNAQLLFETSVQTPDENGYECVLGNLNHDTFPDIYISSHFDQTGDPGKIWINNGDGTFTANQSIGYEQITHHAAFADLDNDGDLDLFLANDASYSGNATYAKGCPNEVWFNNGEGNFVNSGQLLGYEPSNKIILADVDNDHDIDAVIGNYHPGDDPTWSKFKPDEIWLNDGKGTFSLKQSFGYGMGYPFMVDVDNDSDLDAIVQDTLWINDVNALFTKSLTVFNFGDKVNTCQFGDLDNDGDADAVIGMWDAQGEIWLNDGEGNLVNSNQNLGKLKCNNITILDIDLDGDLDVFMDNNGGPCKLWINQGGNQNGSLGIFQDSNIELPAGSGILCDFNKDGRQDALIGNKVWLNSNLTSIKERTTHHLTIYPNPSKGQIFMEQNGKDDSYSMIKLFSLSGEILITQQVHNKISEINIEQLAKGVYLVNLYSEGITYTSKIIKE